jgi:predicted RNA methylase
MAVGHTNPGLLADLVYRMNLATWDIGEAQPIILMLLAVGAITGRVLDAGCGTGWNAIAAAKAGCEVTGVDISPTAIGRARRNAAAEGVNVGFVHGDVTELACEGLFDTVLDSKCYDNLEPADRPRYLSGLHRALRPGARLFLFGFGPGHVNGVHNHALEEPDYEQLLPKAGFRIDHIGETTYLMNNPGYKPLCDACPPRLPANGRQHIPMTAVHATRSQALTGSALLQARSRTGADLVEIGHGTALAASRQGRLTRHDGAGTSAGFRGACG